MNNNEREAYLVKGVEMLSPLFAANGITLPPVKVSCSWPGGGSKQTRIGECWPRKCSAAQINEIFISPSIENSVRALDILTHELIHAVDDCEHGHKGPFVSMMKAIGLEGKPTATIAGERLHGELQAIVDTIGEYPHAKLTAPGPKQKSRQLKAWCEDCGAVWRMSSLWIQQAVTCPCCQSDSIDHE